MVSPVSYNINVQTVGKKDKQLYSYSGTDTVGNLKDKIFQNEGVPSESQRLVVESGWWIWRKTVELNDDQSLLRPYLEGASYVQLFLKTIKSA